MHYLIFLPRATGADPQNLVKAGLGDLLRTDDLSPMGADLVGTGPGDLPGQVWAWGNAIPVYLPESQIWTADKLGRYWVGVSKTSPPTPAELLRKTAIRGLDQVMADGQTWVIPNVMRLPQVFDLDDQDQPIRVPHPNYRSFADECGWAMEAVLAGLTSGVGPNWKRALDFAVMALSVNYRINRSIAVLLGILEEKLLFTVMSKATDADRILAVVEDVKKKATASMVTG